MRLDQLERHNNIHRVFAESIRKEFTRIWGRPLSAEETDTIDSSVLCRSFMSLEMDELRLSKASDLAQADETFSSLVKSVAEHRRQVHQALIDAAARLGILRVGAEDRNLLVVENELLHAAQSQAAKPAR